MSAPPSHLHPIGAAPAVSPPRTLAEYREELGRVGVVSDLGFDLIRFDAGEDQDTPNARPYWSVSGNGLAAGRWQHGEHYTTERAALLRFAQLVRTERDAARVRELRESA